MKTRFNLTKAEEKTIRGTYCSTQTVHIVHTMNHPDQTTYLQGDNPSTFNNKSELHRQGLNKLMDPVNNNFVVVTIFEWIISSQLFSMAYRY